MFATVCVKKIWTISHFAFVWVGVFPCFLVSIFFFKYNPKRRGRTCSPCQRLILRLEDMNLLDHQIIIKRGHSNTYMLRTIFILPSLHAKLHANQVKAKTCFSPKAFILRTTRFGTFLVISNCYRRCSLGTKILLR